MAPIMALNRITRVLSASAKTITRALTVRMMPVTGFPPLMMVQPSQMPTVSER